MDRDSLFGEYKMMTTTEYDSLTKDKKKYMAEISLLKQALYKVYSNSTCADTVRYCRKVLDGEE